MFRPSRRPLDAPRPHPRPRRRPRVRHVCAAGALCAALAVGATALPGVDPLPRAYALDHTEPLPDGADRPADGPGLTVLVVGVDGRAHLDRRQRDALRVGGEGCDCTDTMMLWHLSEDRRRISVLSLPRDSYVPFARPAPRARHAEPVPEAGKINAAFKAGGPALAVRTVEQATGVRVDHYLEADFAGFATVVDDLGGAPVCTRHALRDPAAGLDLPAGSHLLDGRDALSWARTRKVEPPGDLGRVRRQQQLMAKLLLRLAGEGVLSDPARLAGTARTLLSSLRADPALTAGRLAEIGRSVQGIRPQDMEFATVPIADFDHAVPGWGMTLLWDGPRAERLFAALRTDAPLTSRSAYERRGPVVVGHYPSEVSLRVRRVDARRAQADRVREGLRASGFRVQLRTAPGPAGPPHTEVRHDPRFLGHAATVAAALPGARLVAVPGMGRMVEVRPGASPRVVRVVEDRSSVEGAPVTARKLDCFPERS